VKPTLISLALVCCGLAAGCGGDDIGRTVPVKGTVTVNGQPLKGGSVAYWPDEAGGNTSKLEAVGQVSDSGTYELVTRGKPGAIPGKYKVVVAAATTVDSSKASSAPKAPFNASFQSRESTLLKVEVSDSPSAGQYDLKLN